MTELIKLAEEQAQTKRAELRNATEASNKKSNLAYIQAHDKKVRAFVEAKKALAQAKKALEKVNIRKDYNDRLVVADWYHVSDVVKANAVYEAKILAISKGLNEFKTKCLLDNKPEAIVSSFKAFTSALKAL